MKTRQQFVELADAYRIEIRRRGFVLSPLMVLAIIAWIGAAALMGRFLGNHSVLIGIWTVLFFITLLGLNLYQVKSHQSLARKFELVCPGCSHVIGLADLKLAIATRNCPCCGNPIFS